MSEVRRSDIPDEVVARRLDELAQVDRLMRALREVRFVDAPSEVRDGPAPRWNSPEPSGPDDAPKPPTPS